MRKKLLYIITQSEFGGAQRYVFDLAKNLKNEFEVLVAAGENPNGELFQKLQKTDIENIYLKHLKRSINPWHDILAFFEIRKLIKKEKPDIIHLNSTKAGILGSLASKFVYSHNSKADLHYSHQIIYTAHGWVFNDPLPWFKKKIYFWLEKSTAKYKNIIICVSEYDRQAALKQGFPKDKLVTIHNGIDFDKIDFLPKEDARQQLFNLIKIKEKTSRSVALPLGRSAAQIIGTIANLYPAKGIGYLIEAARLLSAKNKIHGIKFFIIGEGAERRNLESKIKNYGLEDIFFLTGHIPDAFKYLKSFDMFVLPSIKEGLPYVILEAMAANIPIIATRTGGIPEIIEHKKTGLLVEPKNSQDLAEKIDFLLNNDMLNINYTNDFPLEKMIIKTKEAYLKRGELCFLQAK